MNEAIRVGVFICDCGSNIAGVVNVPELVEYTRGLDQVVFADEGRWSCSVDYLTRLQNFIKEHHLNRVVIASCTPRTHEPLFKQTVKEAGLNPYLLEFVSIREQVSWVHRGEPERATAKAKDLVRMGVAKAVLLEEGEEIRLPVGRDCLIIGGGMAGLTAALNIADQGFQAVLVEKAPRLGGLLNRINRISHDQHTLPAREILEETIARVENHPQVKVFTGTEIESLEGYIGNYRVVLNSNGTQESWSVSTVIVATGMKEVEPSGWYDYGVDPRVITQLQLEERLKTGEKVSLVVEFAGFEFFGDFEAAKKDLQFGIGGYKHIHRAAFVGDQRWIAWFTRFVGPFTRTEEKQFPTGQLEEAISWASG